MAKNIKEVLDGFDGSLKLTEIGWEAYGEFKQEALAEIKRIIEEAKPVYGVMGGEIQRIRNGGRNKAIDKYHDSLLKALGE